MSTKPLVLFLTAVLCGGAVPTPKEHLGFTPGDDYKLADSTQIFGYFRKAAAASDRMRLVEFGKSALGKPMYVAYISSPENLKRLDRFREIASRLALGKATPAEAQALAREGKAVVWIDSGLHASEVAPVQHAPELAYKMLTGDTPEIRAILENVILMQVPVINPDGLDWVAHWYAQNVGTPYELAPLPWLYHRYAGHDNNRDWFMLNLVETRHVTKLLFRDWFPHIVYNQHQVPPFPARIFIPPYAEPLNPHIPAAVMEGINLIGSAMKERFARENKPGVISYLNFDGWWNGGLRSTPAFHNMHGILTETALHMYATPKEYSPDEIRSHFANGIPTKEPSIFYQRPWLGGKWGIRDAIEYMLTADFAILNHAAVNREHYLKKSWDLARQAIEAGARGNPFAYVLPEQWDRQTAYEMLDRLQQAGVEVRRATASFQAGGKQYPAGTYVLPAAQPFRPYLMDLMEPHKYPEIRASGTGPTKRPYDIAGWTLPMQMGVNVDRVNEPFEARLESVETLKAEGDVSGSGRYASLDRRENNVFAATAYLLDRGEAVQWAADGTVLVKGASVENPAAARGLAQRFGVTVRFQPDAPQPAYEVRKPRVALYNPSQPNMDQGWTEWVFERYQVPFAIIGNRDFNADLNSRFDTIVFASQGAASILHGTRHGELTGREGDPSTTVTAQRPEYTGGIELSGLAALETFVRAGGTLIALDAATELPIQYFPLSVRNVARSGEVQFYCPGSLLRFNAAEHPAAFGMPREFIGFASGGAAFEITVAPEHNTGGREIRPIARFAAKDLLASGWVSGERAVLDKHAALEARHGKGRVILFGFRPQFRAQPFGTFKLLLNAVYLGSARPL